LAVGGCALLDRGARSAHVQPDSRESQAFARSCGHRRLLGGAQKHGWTCTDGACTKDGAEASFWLGVALPQSNRQIYDQIELDGQWYGALP
jgi:hypothetical protein